MTTKNTNSESPVDLINRLADVIMGMNDKPSAQTLMVRPVSTSALTFYGKFENFELFEDLFYTIIKMQLDMTETMNVTAACPYPALRLDKLYAALIRCLVLWTVTKQILVFLFKGLYLLAGGSDVTRGISCDSSLH